MGQLFLAVAVFLFCIITVMFCYIVTWRMSWRRDVMWLHRCILARRSTSLILSGSHRCRLKVVRYRSSNSWMIFTPCSTTPSHVMTSTRSVMCTTVWNVHFVSLYTVKWLWRLPRRTILPLLESRTNITCTSGGSKGSQSHHTPLVRLYQLDVHSYRLQHIYWFLCVTFQFHLSAVMPWTWYGWPICRNIMLACLVFKSRLNSARARLRALAH